MQRNVLLKSEVPVEDDVFLAWEGIMAVSGEAVYRKRQAFIEEFIPIFQKYYSFISGDKEEVSLAYTSHAQQGGLMAQFAALREREKIIGFSMHGIHKDELEMQLGEYPLRRVGSQGQQKNYLIAMKLAQALYFSNQSSATSSQQTKSNRPLLLLDDSNK